MVFTFLMFLFLKLVFEPKLFKRRQYSSWLTILFLMALGLTYGVIGLVLAPPLATAIEIFIYKLSQEMAGEDDAVPEEGTELKQIHELQGRFAEVEKVVAASPEAMSPKLQSVMDRMRDLLKDAAGVVANLNTDR